ncbi:indoleacetamide hydrolase [Ruegeria pomeroyi]|nr:indoleacetamide hydrolase [Ruegeria pomeroyi]
MALDLERLDAVGAVAAIREGVVSAGDYAAALAERAARHAGLNALQGFDAAQCIREAEEAVAATPDGALAGLPIVVKDNINTTTYPTSGGTGALLGHRPATEAGIVRRIRAAGGFVGAKSGMHELAFGITSNNAVTGPVRNPHDPALIPGGSSGGTAAAIAAGIFPLGLGTDTGGSCRIPAALCGTVGFRPSTGRYPGDGVVPISHTLDTVGSFARSVADIALLDRVVTGQAAEPRHSLSGVRLGLPKSRFYDNLDPAVETATQAALTRLEAAGATLVDISLQDIWTHAEAFSIPVGLFEVVRDLPGYLAEHAPGISFDALVEGIGSPNVKGLIASQLGGDAIPVQAYDEAMMVHRPAMLRIYNRVFADNALDAIVFPTTPLTARPIGEDETVELNGARVSTFATYIRNTDLAPNIGAPGISLPCPVSSGLPVGIEFDALPGGDLSLLALARAAEHVLAQ